MVTVRCDCGVVGSIQLKNAERGKSSGCKKCRSAECHPRVDDDVIKDDALRRYWANRWHSIVDRCDNPKASKYQCYGGRGITYAWKSKRDFLLFIQTLDGWDRVLESGDTLDRIDNDQGYAPGNLRLVPFAENQQNKRTTVAIDTPAGRLTASGIKRVFKLRAHKATITEWVRGGADFAAILERDKYAGVRGRDTAACVRRSERRAE
jgi:hypothetical protein